MYENCNNKFVKRSNNHKYCKEHENVNSRKDKLKNKKRKHKDEDEVGTTSSNKENDKSLENTLNDLKSIKKEFEELKPIKKEINEPKLQSEHNTPASNSKKPNLLDILMKRTSSEPYNCIGKNKPFHNNLIPQKVDKSIQTDDLFEFIPKIKKFKVDKNVGTEDDITLEPTFPTLENISTQQFTNMLDTPTKNIQSIKSPLSTKRYLKNTTEYPLRDISNIINCKYLKSPISDRKSPKFLTKPFKLPEYDNNNKENSSFNIVSMKRQLNASTSYSNENMSFLSLGIPEEEILNFENKQKDIYNTSISNTVDNGDSNLDNENESSSNSHTVPVDYYMEYIKILKKISQFSPSQELKQTLSSNSNLTTLNNHVLSPAKTDAEDLLNWLNIE
jgi:hypothetical protein